MEYTESNQTCLKKVGKLKNYIATKTQRHKERIRLKTEERQEKKPSAFFNALCLSVFVACFLFYELYKEKMEFY